MTMAIAMLLMLVTAPVSCEGASGYGVARAIGPIGSDPRDINDKGVVVGVMETEDTIHAFRWSERTGMITLYGPDVAVRTVANGINEAGTVVGAYGNSACLWTTSGSYIDLGSLPGHVGSIAYDINDKGAIVGWSFSVVDVPFSEPEHKRPVIWTADRTGYHITELDMIAGAVSGRAYAINQAGEVIGKCVLEDAGIYMDHVCLWSSDGTVTDLGSYGPAPFTAMIDINDKGVAVGYYYLGSDTGGTHGLVLDPVSGMEVFDIIAPDVVSTDIWGINDKGDMVGTVAYSDSSYEGYVRTSDGTITYLGSAGLVGEAGTVAGDINKKGTVIGVAEVDVGGVYHPQFIIWERR